MSATRKERDFLGEIDVPAEAHYGAQTQRAVLNFPISGVMAHPRFIRAMGLIKKAAALANAKAGRLDDAVTEAIVGAAEEVIEGALDDHFVVDVFQAGAGTSFHMNANEVIANRAAEALGLPRGDHSRVHPNDHVNLGQSTNDVFPTAMRLAALAMAPDLLDALRDLAGAFREKAEAFAGFVKSGRTHLQDATPVTLGQEFGGYAKALEKSVGAVESELDDLRALGIGGSAVGTGLTAHKGYRQAVTEELTKLTGEPLRCAENTFEAMQSMAPFVRLSGELRALAVELIRICNDLRLLGSGPNTGFAEINLPPVQPGSSIMPGKVNPVICECMNMVCFQVVGADTTIMMAAQAGQMELNVMMPAVNHNLLTAMHILTNGLRMLTEKCVRGITANADTARDYAHASLALATLLKTRLGYQAAAELAHEAHDTGRRIGELVVEKGLMTREELERLVSPEALDPDNPTA